MRATVKLVLLSALTLGGCVAGPDLTSSSDAVSSQATSFSSAQSSLGTIQSSQASSLEWLPSADQCDSTAQCAATFPNATDCKNSKADNSVCYCGDLPCVISAVSSANATSSSAGASVSSSVPSSQAQSSSAPMLSGEALYLDLCSGCHDVNGKDGFNLNNDGLNTEQMISAITEQMPPAQGGSMPSDCIGSCAVLVTDYIKNTLFAGGATASRAPLVARLTKQQLIHSIEDIFAIHLPADVTSAIPNELIDEKGFASWVESQQMSASHVEAYFNLANRTVNLMDVPALASRAVNCANTSSSCAQKWVQYIGKKLFRKPLINAEIDHYQALFSSVATIDGANFNDAASAVVLAMLQAPQFIYRLEIERDNQTVRALNGYELAARLSYFMWQSTPDDALLAFAADVELSGVNEARMVSEVTRLMNDEKFARARTQFWQDYTITSTAAILGAEPPLANELQQSLMATLERASGVGAPAIRLQELFSLTDMVLSGEMATRMGLASQGSGLKVYSTKNIAQRTGVFSHPGYLANIGSTSFVGRGVVLTERVLCRELPNPPSNIQFAIDDAALATENLTPRQASDYRFNLGGQCENCHRNFEPIAFAFEQLDVLGFYSPQDLLGRDLFSHGYLQTSTGGIGDNYNDVAGLMALLANSEETSACFVQNMLSFASGRKHALVDDVTIQSAHENYLASGGTFNALVRAIALHPDFRTLTTAAE